MPKSIEIEQILDGTAAKEKTVAPAPLKQLEEEKVNKAFEEEKEPFEEEKGPQDPSTQTQSGAHSVQVAQPEKPIESILGPAEVDPAK